MRIECTWLKDDEGLTLERSAFQIFHGGNSPLSTRLIKPNFLLTLLKLLSPFAHNCQHQHLALHAVVGIKTANNSVKQNLKRTCHCFSSH